MRPHRRLELSSVSRSALAAVCAGPADREACGFLRGRDFSTVLKITSVVPTPNLYACPDRFAIADDALAGQRETSGDESELLGLYHSHFGDTRLSAIDRATLRLVGGVWLVIQHVESTEYVRTTDWRAYTCLASRIIRIPIATEVLDAKG